MERPAAGGKARLLAIAATALAACGDRSDSTLTKSGAGGASSAGTMSAAATPSPSPAPTNPPPVTPDTGNEMPGVGAILQDPVTAPVAGEPPTSPDAGVPSIDPDLAPPAPAGPGSLPFTPCPADGSPCAVMPLGDSITFGTGSSGGGYRVELFRRALANQRAITFVGTAEANGPQVVEGQLFPRSHQGHSGFTISGGGSGSLAGLVDDAIAASHPHIVLLMIGTNDINRNVDIENAPARLAALLDQISARAPDALLVVAQIVPTHDDTTNARVEAYNAAIPALVEERLSAGKHLLLVDMYAPFVAVPDFETTLMGDFLHPDDAGYVVMGRTWYSAIESLLPE